MSPLDIVLVAWVGVRRRALRSALTAASLLIGVVTVVVVQGSASLVEAATVERALLAGGPATTMLVPLSPDTADPDDRERWWQERLGRLTTDVGGAVAEYDSYSSVALGSDGSTTPVTLWAVGQRLRSIRPLRVVHGSWLSGRALVPHLVVNQAAWTAMAPGEGPVGLSRPDGLGSARVRVVGVVDDGTTEPTAYVSTDDRAQLRAAGLDPVSRSLLVSSATIDESTLSSRVSNLARVTGRSTDLGDVTRTDQLDRYDEQLRTTRRVFLAIAALSLVIGGLGILNIGLATLRERSDELSLRRALGATRAQIMTIMMLESQFVALTAAAGAALVAYLAVPRFLDHVTSVPVQVTGLPLAAMGLGVAASSLAAALGALAPSLRASRVPIASMMR